MKIETMVKSVRLYKKDRFFFIQVTWNFYGQQLIKRLFNTNDFVKKTAWSNSIDSGV